jgi:uncharacterized protein (UPF0332 family)
MIDAVNFFESAKKLCEQNSEVDYRNAISRAYYAAYHAALALNDLIENHGGIKSGVGVHEQLVTKFTNCPTSINYCMKIKSIGYLLRDAKNIRRDADYFLAIDFTKEDAKEQLKTVKQILEKVAEIEALINQQRMAA